ncbi:MAG: YybS family protein [Thermoleophilia bacterium]|nr:YybS family protein [Thermoleophilia bacterium]
MEGFSTHAVSEGGKAVALAVVLSMVAVYVPLFAFVLIPVLPLPLGYLTLRRGFRVGLAAAVATSALGLLLAGIAQGMPAVLFAGLLGVALGVVLRRRWGVLSHAAHTGSGGRSRGLRMDGCALVHLRS